MCEARPSGELRAAILRQEDLPPVKEPPVLCPTHGCEMYGEAGAWGCEVCDDE